MQRCYARSKRSVCVRGRKFSMRLDVYLAEYWPERSRAQWQKLCKQGFVTINGETVTSPKFELGEDDAVAVDPPKDPDFSDETLPVIFEDENVTVINKPAGILTHAKGAPLEEFTVAEFMRGRTSDKPEGNRPGIVHRLDRDTSGVIICARNPETQSFLQRQFSERKVKKTYLAVLAGIPKQNEAIIRLPLERNPKAMSTYRVNANGKPAETFYNILWQNEEHALVELKPLTGRTHQLRVHMAYMKTPILHDRFYGKTGKMNERLALHARQLEIIIPGGTRKTFIADIPEDVKKYLPLEAWHAVA